MRTAEQVVDDLADAILDGIPVDWTAVESSAEGAARPLVTQLRVVAAIADLDRGTQPTAPDVPPSLVTRNVVEQLERWGHLRLLEHIGRGAFGDVYRAWDARLDREVALKLLSAASLPNDGRSTSIISEGRLLARVRHPNVVTIYGAAQVGDQIGLWMEFVRGRTLEQPLDDGKKFTVEEILNIGRELCLAVAAVHRAGLLHRDIKAQNVVLADDGRVVLMDLGTGRELLDDDASDLAGTPLYLAPEVLHGQKATVRSDIYSLGVLLYHLATGSYPVHARTIGGVRRAHEHGERTAVHTARPDLPASLARVIERALDSNLERRYQDVDTLMAALSRVNVGARVGRRLAVAVALFVVAAIGAHWSVPWMTDAPVIAVLPFENLSAEPESEYFVDGLTDEIIRNLSVVEGLEVRSRTSSFTFKNRPRNTREVGEVLDANLVVEGSVLRVGEKLRVNAQLVRVSDDAPLWSGRFDRELTDIFTIQDEISRSIVNELRLKLGRGQRRYDTNLEAYDLYLKARALIDRRGVPNAETAADLFEQVIARDSAFAPAHAGLANAYAFMSLPSGGIPFETAHSIMRPAAVKAVQLDPLLADAHVAMGWVYSRERDWTNAEQTFRRALELNPNLTQAYTSYSISTLQPLGKLDESLRLLRVALRNDPLSLDVQREIGEVQLYAGRYHEAIETLQRVRAADPDFPFVNMFLARALMFAGRVADAIPLLEQLDGRYSSLSRGEPASVSAENSATVPWRLAHAYVRTGRRPEAEKLVAEHQGYPYRLATIYAALGDKDRIFDALDRMAVTEPQRVGRLLIAPEMALLRGDPRLAMFRKRFGLP